MPLGKTITLMKSFLGGEALSASCLADWHCRTGLDGWWIWKGLRSRSCLLLANSETADLMRPCLFSGHFSLIVFSARRRGRDRFYRGGDGLGCAWLAGGLRSRLS
jgi:hypothetical protein